MTYSDILICNLIYFSHISRQFAYFLAFFFGFDLLSTGIHWIRFCSSKCFFYTHGSFALVLLASLLIFYFISLFIFWGSRCKVFHRFSLQSAQSPLRLEDVKEAKRNLPRWDSTPSILLACICFSFWLFYPSFLSLFLWFRLPFGWRKRGECWSASPSLLTVRCGLTTYFTRFQSDVDRIS